MGSIESSGAVHELNHKAEHRDWPCRIDADASPRPYGPPMRSQGPSPGGLLAPPGVPAGTRSGFGLPVAPPFAPYGDPAPGTAMGAWPVIGGLRLADRRLSRLGFLFRNPSILRLATGAENCCTCDCYDEQFHRVVLLWAFLSVAIRSPPCRARMPGHIPFAVDVSRRT